MNITKLMDYVIKNTIRVTARMNIYDDTYGLGLTRPFTKLLIGKKNLVGAEIGVHAGKNSLSMMKNLDIKMLYGIDPYVVYDGYVEECYEQTQKAFNSTKQQAYDKLRNYMEHYTFVTKFSNDAVNDVPDELDFVYVDGNHEYSYVKDDIKNWYPKIKKGGVIGGHNYFDMTDEHFGVHKAVNEFSVNNNIDLFFKYPDWWMIK